MHHPKADTEGLYIKREKCGRGLIRIYQQNNQVCLDITTDWVLQLVKEYSISKEKKNLLKTRSHTEIKDKATETAKNIKKQKHKY